LRLEPLEPRLAPSATPWLTENFDGTTAGNLPAGWSQWDTTGASVAVGSANGVGGSHGLAVTAAVSQAAAHAWVNTAAAADVEVAASLNLNSLIPAQLIARGSDLNGATSTYYALELTRGLDLELLRVAGGTTTVLADLKSAQWFSDQWVRATLHVEGGQLQAQVQRLDTNQYLTSGGQWQAAQAWALQAGDTAITQAGLVGLARPSSYTGTLNFDDFSVTNLSTATSPASGTGTTTTESFDTTALGSLPAGWKQASSDGSAAFRVTTGTALSPANGLSVVASTSNLSARAWLAAAEPADLRVGAAVYASSLIPAQLVARGANLDTAAPTYYALALTRGLTVQLVKVVNGTTTVLGQLNSAAWFSDRWAQATFEVSGTTLKAQVVRSDTGQYLNASGTWQTAQAWALTATDSTITQAGAAGLARPASYTGTATFDDFQVTPLSASPAPSSGVSESFDTTAASALPAGWSQSSSDGSSAFGVEAGTALSPSNGLAVVANTSSVSSRAWLQASQPADVQVTAAVLANSLIPAQVLARGSGLDTTAPSYYALALTRGLTVQIVKVVGGTTTSLGQLTSSSWTSDLWARATLQTTGTTLKAQVYRTDTGQYLNSAGQWQTSQTWALTATDSSLTQGGYVGLARPASYAGTVVFDDFGALAGSGDTTPPTVTLQAPAAGSTLTGTVTVQATAQDAGGVARVEFYVDGGLRATVTAAPYQWAFDSSTASNATHTLTVKAYDLAGNVGAASVQVTTSNASSLPKPTIPQHLPNIRIAELAYSGLTFGTFEDNLLANDVDLVVADSAFASHIHSVAPNTPQAAYTNFSNIYLDLLTDWTTYADKNAQDRESAFYHVTQATAFSGNSSSSQPVNWFWAAFRGSTTLTDVTARSRGTSPGGVTFGGSGESAYLGYDERFREININLASGAGAGWSAALEYASAVDANGNPTAWSTLTTLSNGTAGLTHSGQILFDPPADWKAASVGGSARLFFVRFRTTGSGTAPVAATILGRDYVGAAGTTQGIIPAFDTAADTNHDGYLSDAEYAKRAPGKDARFLYESRLFYPSYGQMRFATNPASTAYRAWAADYATRFLTGNPYDSVLFVDNSGGASPVGNASVAETATNYATDYATLLNGVGQAITPKWILANTAGGGTSADSVAQHVQAYFEEFEIRPLAHTYQQFESVAATLAERAALTAPSPLAVLDSLPTNGSPTDARTQLATLAYYYLVADPKTTFLDFFGGYAPATSWSQHWSAAAAYDIGQPTGTWSQFATGSDPLNSALTYKVYQRTFGNALVFYKPLSTDSTGTVLGSLSSATTHALNGTYRPLLADGTLGAAVTSVTLRNGEGAILIKVS
jgi:hypothetical protein